MKRDKNLINQTSHTPKNSQPLLEITNLSVSFRKLEQGLREKHTEVLHQFNLTIEEGEIVAIVGASGSGKSVLADAILGILPSYAEVSGTMRYKGQTLTRKNLEKTRGSEIFLIPQSVNALDPLMKSGKQVQSMIRNGEKQSQLQQVFQKVDLPLQTKDLYPFELSGGMARRILLSCAFVSKAKLIIADEPTPGLDEETLNEIIKMMKELSNEGRGMMFITHDIMTALHLADRIAVVYAGELLEVANVNDFTGKGEKLSHPYTKALWNALPQNDFTSISDFSQKKSEIESDGIPHA